MTYNSATGAKRRSVISQWARGVQREILGARLGHCLRSWKHNIKNGDNYACEVFYVVPVVHRVKYNNVITSIVLWVAPHESMRNPLKTPIFTLENMFDHAMQTYWQPLASPAMGNWGTCLPPRLPTVSFLVHFGVGLKLTAKYCARSAGTNVNNSHSISTASATKLHVLVIKQLLCHWCLPWVPHDLISSCTPCNKSWQCHRWQHLCLTCRCVQPSH